MKSPSTQPHSRLAQSLATASGALAATVATAQASTVQITLSGNFINSSTNQLFADLTGDGTNDVALTSPTVRNALVRVKVNEQYIFAVFSSSSATFYARARFATGGVGLASAAGDTLELQNIKYLNPISFTDLRINGGAATQGYLEVNAFNASKISQTLALTRLVFDDASTTLGTSGLSTSATYTEWSAVPEPSSLGMLALGAGGLLARRRRQPAA